MRVEVAVEVQLKALAVEQVGVDQEAEESELLVKSCYKPAKAEVRAQQA